MSTDTGVFLCPKHYAICLSKGLKRRYRSLLLYNIYFSKNIQFYLFILYFRTQKIINDIHIHMTYNNNQSAENNNIDMIVIIHSIS